jgi:hypothetical protein
MAERDEIKSITSEQQPAANRNRLDFFAQKLEGHEKKASDREGKYRKQNEHLQLGAKSNT